MISHLCEKIPEALRERGVRVAPAVLTCLGDQDAGVSVWEASIHLLGVLHDPWSLVNPTKAVYPGSLWFTMFYMILQQTEINKINRSLKSLLLFDSLHRSFLTLNPFLFKILFIKQDRK